MNTPVFIEIIPIEETIENVPMKRYDVFLHHPDMTQDTQWTTFGTVPFRFVGCLSAEEVGQYMGGS